MKFIKTIVAALAVVTAVSSCDMSDFGDVNDNPNYPTEGSTASLFIYSARYVRNFIFNSYYYDIWTQEYPGYLSESSNNQYGPLDCTTQFSTSSFYLYPIKNLNTIIEKNTNAATKNESSVQSFGSNANQIAVARTLRAFFYMSMTDILGPIPYSETFQGDSLNNWTPALDSVEKIYTSLDDDLCEAYAQFDENGSLSDDDIIYGGDISKWKKLNATLRMMMAIKLKDVSPTLGEARFHTAYSDGGMETADDSFTYTYDSYAGSGGTTVTNYSPMYCVAQGLGSASSKNHVPSKTIVDALKKYNDPRLFTYCDVSSSAYKGKAGAYGTDDQRSYRGVPFGLSSNTEVNSQSKYCCSVGSKYCQQTATYGVITAARTLLVEAEARELGWIKDQDAEDLYRKGIQASWDFEGSSDNSWNSAYNTSANFDAYMSQKDVVLSKDPDEAIKQIVMQRWLAGYLTDGVEAWADWRINNVPEMPMYQGQLDNGHETYPYRMGYEDEDISTEEAQYTEAMNKYFDGSNDRWKRIWWDVKDNTSPVGVLETDDEIAAYSPVSWTAVGTGTMQYALDIDDWIFGTEAGTTDKSVSGLTLYQQNEDPTIYKIEGWSLNEDVTLQFTVASDGTITVPMTACGSNGSYTFACADYNTFAAYSWEYPDYYDTSLNDYLGTVCKKNGNKFTFYLAYVLNNYYAPYYMMFDPTTPEVFTLDN